MSLDIATHPTTGDWLFSANRDMQVVKGSQVVQQRIRNRLKIVRGTWALDPTNGALGSRLDSILRIPRGRALQEIKLMVSEALSPMEDVEIIDIQTQEGVRSITVNIDYVIVEPGLVVSPEDRLRETLTIELPA